MMRRYCPACSGDSLCRNCHNKITDTISSQARKTEEKLKRHITNLEESNKRARLTSEKFYGQLVEDLESTLAFLQSPPPISDIVLVASDESYPLPVLANRAVLKCRSPVFRAQLEDETSISGIIEIGHVSSETLAMFVNFLYTAKAILDQNKACDLLMLGDKYQIPHLKTYCERFLSSVLKWENALPIYAFARQHNSRSLRDSSLSLILKDMRKLSKRRDYAQFLEKDPLMIVSLYEAYNYK